MNTILIVLLLILLLGGGGGYYGYNRYGGRGLGGTLGLVLLILVVLWVLGVLGGGQIAHPDPRTGRRILHAFWRPASGAPRRNSGTVPRPGGSGCSPGC